MNARTGTLIVLIVAVAAIILLVLSSSGIGSPETKSKILDPKKTAIVGRVIETIQTESASDREGSTEYDSISFIMKHMRTEIENTDHVDAEEFLRTIRSGDER